MKPINFKKWVGQEATELDLTWEDVYQAFVSRAEREAEEEYELSDKSNQTMFFSVKFAKDETYTIHFYATNETGEVTCEGTHPGLDTPDAIDDFVAAFDEYKEVVQVLDDGSRKAIH